MSPNEETRLGALRALNLLDTPPEERFDRLTRLTQRTFGAPIVVIALVDRDRAWFKSRIGLAETEFARQGAFCDETLEGGMLVVPDATKDPRFAGHRLVAGPPGIRFYAGHPLKGPDGSMVGSLSVFDTVPRTIDNEQRRALRDLAGMVEEQLASPLDPGPDDEHARLLARLRLTPENASARRRARWAFLILTAALFAGTALALHASRELGVDAAAVERFVSDAAVPAGVREAAAAPLARMRSNARFFRVAVGVRAALAIALLFLIYAIFERQMEVRLSTLAAVELDRARLKAVIDAVTDGIVVADARGRFTLFNPAAERILGLGMFADPAHSERFYASFFEEDGTPRAAERHPLTRAIAGESVRGRLVVRNERRPGGVPVAVTAEPVRAFDGSPAGGVVFFRDVV